MAYVEISSYVVMTGHECATFIGTGPYMVMIYRWPQQHAHLQHGKQTHADFPINDAPTLRELDLAAPSRIVELIEVPVGDWSPFDSKLADIDPPLWMFVIPPKFMVLYFFGRIVVLGVIVAQGNSLRAQLNRR